MHLELWDSIFQLLQTYFGLFDSGCNFYQNSLKYLLALSGVIPKGGGQSSSVGEMERDGYLFSFVGQSAVAVEKQ